MGAALVHVVSERSKQSRIDFRGRCRIGLNFQIVGKAWVRHLRSIYGARHDTCAGSSLVAIGLPRISIQ